MKDQDTDVTTFEIELERDKAEKLSQVAQRGGQLAEEVGQDPAAVTTFLLHYFRHVDANDVDERTVEDLLGVVASHYRSALERPVGQTVISARTPSQSDDGWTAGGATVIQIVTDDRPFLVDSVTLEVLRQGWSIREVFHPQFYVRRSPDGTMDAVITAAEADGDPAAIRESWMHLEILPPERPARPELLVPELEHGLREVLQLVEESVEDWQKMITRAEETIELLKDTANIGDRGDDAALACELLAWLNTNHFTFLGYREFTLHGDEAGPVHDRTGAGDRPGHAALRCRRGRCVPRPAAAQHPALPDDHHQGRLPLADPPPGLPRLPGLPALRTRRQARRRASLPRPVLVQRLLRERQPRSGHPAEGGRRPDLLRI